VWSLDFWLVRSFNRVLNSNHNVILDFNDKQTVNTIKMLLLRSLRANFVRHYQHKPMVEILAEHISANKISPKYEKALKTFEGKILFNSVLEVQSVRLRKYDAIMTNKERRVRKMMDDQIKPLPLVLRQLCEGAEKLDMQEEPVEQQRVEVQDLPYSRFLRVEQDSAPVSSEEKVPKNWLRDYELYDELDEDLPSRYGTPNLKIPVSKVPCQGCGSLLHCKEPSIPGYIPSELFGRLDADELTTVNCQRCHFLVNYNTAINVTVKPEDYIKIVSTIKDKHALAVVLVDLLDFPCSIFKGLKELLGSNRPIFIVGNKVDLLPKDHPDNLNHIKKCLKEEAIRMGFGEQYVKHIALISAKTGFGVEELITKLHMEWNYRGDVYLIGCTNVGKSSLFNALLKSDYCKVQASDIIQKATACPWPGTTLRMLKFPILKPSDHRLFLRVQRLNMQRKKNFLLDQVRREKAVATKQIEHATLIGHIGRTFEEEKDEVNDPASFNMESGYTANILTLNEKSEKYALSRWCYDTPGVIQDDQVSFI
jgi:nitric oxide-associated protein 1